jgi:UDP-4-amino-4-deoxy-L-arabinose formyltransferase/UDP-glucuronic acid dehydrogenase (UDP-4-keto-hexauronic acid decarboxylating)
MVWFVVIGEGRPARAVLDVIIAAPNATAEAMVIADAERNPLAECAGRQALAMVDTRDLLGECRRLAGRSEGWLVSANSTIIIPREVLELFEGRSLNLHPGLLPEYAGLHTHQWAIRNGEREFGVTVHRVEPQIDAGAIVGQVRFPISPEDTGLSLFSRCLTAGRELFSRIIAQITRGEALTDVPQDLARRRLYRHRDALDGRIDWNESAVRITDFIRAGNYEPFVSPSYVARLDRMGGFDVEVLRATREGVSTACPGAVVDVSAAGPLITCGDGATIRIVKARHGREAMSTERWHEYISHVPDGQLLGRSETQA